MIMTKYAKEKLTKEFVAGCIISYRIEMSNEFGNCKYCPISDKCLQKNKDTKKKYKISQFLNILDRQSITCFISILKYFNNEDNYNNYINNLKECDIIALFKAYRMNYYLQDICKYIDNSLLNCPLYYICNKYSFKYNCCFKNENDKLLIWNVEPIKNE